MLNKIDKVLTHVENAITGSLFIASLLVLGWNIIMRKVFSSLLACGFCVFCAWYGWSLTDMVITNNRVSAAMEMPMWILYISIPIGFGLTAIRFLIDAIQKLRQDEKPAIDKTDDGEIDISMM